jgi:hypothetical protein
VVKEGWGCGSGWWYCCVVSYESEIVEPVKCCATTRGAGTERARSCIGSCKGGATVLLWQCRTGIGLVACSSAVKGHIGADV